MSAIIVPKGYSYVLAAAVSTYWLNAWQFTQVGGARKKAGISYPQLYAEKAEVTASADALAFNCTQRAHQNTLESVTHLIFGILITGLKFPYLSAGMGGLWVVARVIYTLNYSTGEPKKRNTKGGFLSFILYGGFLATSTYTVYELVRAGI